MHINLRNGVISMNIEIEDRIVDEVIVDGHELYPVRDLEQVSVLSTYKGEDIVNVEITPIYEYRDCNKDENYEIFS